MRNVYKVIGINYLKYVHGFTILYYTTNFKFSTKLFEILQVYRKILWYLLLATAIMIPADFKLSVK